MSELHRKPLVELISPVASQNEILIGNRTKIHALLAFSIKLDKIRKEKNSSKLLRTGPKRRKVAYRHTPHGIHHLQHHHL